MLHFFFIATFPVKCIMLVLIGISVYSWRMILQYYHLFQNKQQAFRDFEHRLWQSKDLEAFYQSEDAASSDMAQIFVTGFREIFHENASSEISTAVTKKIAAVMNNTCDRLYASEVGQLSTLATIGSVSPYIGLLGTVLGIMHALSMINPADPGAIVHIIPGICEALVTTAIGLFVAIPAVFAYNRFTHQLNDLYARYEICLTHLKNILED